MKKAVTFISTLSIGILLFVSSFSIAKSLIMKGADTTSFGIGIASTPTSTLVHFQSKYFYGGEKSVYAYAYNSADTSKKNAAWPGVEMTKEDYEHGLYSYEVEDTFDTIIFNVNEDTTKTADLTIDRTNTYYCFESDTWESSLEDCEFHYYLVGKLNGVDHWGDLLYENGLLINYANQNEYMKLKYTFKQNDEFKIKSKSGTYYGVGGSTPGNNYVVKMKSTGGISQLYFTPNSSLYAGCKISCKYTDKGDTIYCHHWIEGGSGTSWPGDKMTSEGNGIFSCMVSLEHQMVIFNNKGAGGQGGWQTDNIEIADAKTPCYNGSSWVASF